MRWLQIFGFIGLAACGGSGERPGELGRLGAVCGSSDLIGVAVEPIQSSTNRQCGIDHPLRLHEVSGVRLTGRPLMNCATARALETWVERGAKPAIRDLGARLETLQVAAHYACRTRNNQPGGRVSEHGKGNAIDISGFEVSRGENISVLRDWGVGEKGAALRRMWRRACGPFGVVLGPESDRFHRDHFHFDVSNLSNPYCR